MKCPYCGKEMAVGYIHNHSQPVQWLPNGAMPSRIKWTITDNGVPLKNKYKFFKENGSGVGQRIYRVSHAVNQPGTVKCFFI